MEEEVNYASIVFNNPKTSRPNATREDTIYSNIKVNTRGDKAGPAPVTKDKKSANGSNHLPLVVFCLGILCVTLVSAITTLCVYFTRTANEKDKYFISELKHLRHNQTALLAGNHNLTNLLVKLTSGIGDLKNDRDNLTNLIGNLSQAYDILESKRINLTTENLQLNTENINLTRQLENLTRDGVNWTLVQWSLDVYCPRIGDSRDCLPCQKGWLHHSSSCYAIHNAQPVNRTSWQEARDECRRKNSDLTVIDSLEEQSFIYEHSWASTDESNGFWIGLTSESGKWRWVNGRNLTEKYWITPPNAGDDLCATSVQKTKPHGWYAVNCNAKNQWICEMKALTV